MPTRSKESREICSPMIEKPKCEKRTPH